MGFFCARKGYFGKPRGRVNIEHVYSVTGEDTRTFEPKLKNTNFHAGPGMHEGSGNFKCTQLEGRGKRRFWAGNCKEKQPFICEAFDG